MGGLSSDRLQWIWHGVAGWVAGHRWTREARYRRLLRLLDLPSARPASSPWSSAPPDLPRAAVAATVGEEGDVGRCSSSLPSARRPSEQLAIALDAVGKQISPHRISSPHRRSSPAARICLAVAVAQLAVRNRLEETSPAAMATGLGEMIEHRKFGAPAVHG
ncbi:hypothetical protein ACLOJK_011315 [Asimina triloba]